MIDDPAGACNPRPGFYKHLAEIKEMPAKDKLDYSLQITSIIWGPTNFAFAAVLVGVILHKHVWDFLKNHPLIQKFIPAKGGQ